MPYFGHLFVHYVENGISNAQFFVQNAILHDVEIVFYNVLFYCKIRTLSAIKLFDYFALF